VPFVPSFFAVLWKNKCLATPEKSRHKRHKGTSVPGHEKRTFNFFVPFVPFVPSIFGCWYKNKIFV